MDAFSPARARPQRDRSRHAALEAAIRLRTWLQQVELLGIDPYDGLRSAALRRLARSPRSRQAAVQALRRLPVDPRPLLGIRPHANAKGLGIIAAASAKLWSLTGDAAWEALAHRAADAAVELTLETPSGSAWGYPFDVQVRWAYYPAGTPNAIATVFTAGGVIVAGELLGRRDLVERGEAVAPFLDSLATGESGARFYAYVPGNGTPIHNANLLVAALRARICRRRGEDVPAEAGAAIEYSVRRQREDGSWPYGEGSRLEWVDGYHTGYVLCALLDLSSTTGRPDVDAALSSGTRFYLDELFDANGRPLIGPGRRYPLDAHNVATAITTLLRLSGREPRAVDLAGHALELALDRLQARDGWFIYQRGRLLATRIPYLRWANAHMLNALAEFVRLDAEGLSPERDAAAPVP